MDKYSYFYNEQGDFTILHTETDGTETPIAIAPDAEKAHFLVTAANAFRNSPQYPGNEEEDGGRE